MLLVNITPKVSKAGRKGPTINQLGSGEGEEMGTKIASL